MKHDMALMISFLIYTCLAAGILLLSLKEHESLSRVFSGERRLKRRAAGGPSDSLGDMIFLVFGRRTGGSAAIAVLVSVFACTLLASLRVMAPSKALFWAAFISILPAAALKVMYESKRVKSSFEGEALVSAILSEYRINGLNMTEALEAVVLSHDELKYTGRILFLLLSDIRTAGSDEEMTAAASRFASRIGTSWARMAVADIRTACMKGGDITLALEDIMMQLREASLLREERKRLNSESKRMILLMIPGSYLVTAFLGIKSMDMTAGEYMSKQFSTEKGLMFFFLITGMFAGNLLIMELVSNSRFDV